MQALTQLKELTGNVFTTTFIENIEFISSQETNEIRSYLSKHKVPILKAIRSNLLAKARLINPTRKFRKAMPNDLKGRILSDIIEFGPFSFTARPATDDAPQPEDEEVVQPWAKTVTDHFQTVNAVVEDEEIVHLSNDPPPPPPPSPSAVADHTAAAADTLGKLPDPRCDHLQHQIIQLSNELAFLKVKYDHSEGERAKLTDRVKQLDEWLHKKFDQSEGRVKQLEAWTAFWSTVEPDIVKTLTAKTQVGTPPAHTTQVDATTTQVDATTTQVDATTTQRAQPPATTPPTSAQPTTTSPPTPLNQPTVNTVHNTPAMPPTPLEQPITELFISRMHSYDREQMVKYINERVDFNLVLADVQPLHVKNGSAFNVQVPTEKAEAVLAIWPTGIKAEPYKRLGPNAFRGHQKYTQHTHNHAHNHAQRGPGGRNQGPPRHHRGPNRPLNGGPNMPSGRGNPHQQTHQQYQHQTQQYQRYPPSQQQQQQQHERHYQNQQGDNQYQDHHYPRWNDYQQRYQQYHQDRYY